VADAHDLRSRPEVRTAVKQLRKALIKGGSKIERNAFHIIDRRGDKLRCVFVLNLGAPGSGTRRGS